ncbi:MAG: hypothetical protein ACREBS_02755 [Nitrososphaerales archaeon]
MNIQQGTSPDLKGNTLRVYTHLFKVRKAGVRDTQRSLGLKSASLAQYHLEKLVSLGLANKTESGDYVLLTEVKLEVFEQFFKIGRYMVPRFVMYSVMLVALFAYFLVSEKVVLNTFSVWAFIFSFLTIGICCYEVFRAMRRIS